MLSKPQAGGLCLKGQDACGACKATARGIYKHPPSVVRQLRLSSRAHKGAGPRCSRGRVVETFSPIPKQFFSALRLQGSSPAYRPALLRAGSAACARARARACLRIASRRPGAGGRACTPRRQGQRRHNRLAGSTFRGLSSVGYQGKAHGFAPARPEQCPATVGRNVKESRWRQGRRWLTRLG